MNDDINLIKIHQTNDRGLIAVIKSILDSADIQYMITNEYGIYLGSMEILIDRKDEPEVRELLSDILK